MPKLRIAIPSNSPGGLNGVRSEHFGHCEVYTIVDIENNQVAQIETLENKGHEAGGCMTPVRMLAEKNVDALVVGGIGKGPLQGCQELGIKVFFADKKSYKDVDGVVKGMLLNNLPVMKPEHACKGGSNCHGHGHAVR